MNAFTTPRFSLPTLALAQAQKELVHNEALSLIDLLLHAVVEGFADDPAALSPAAGQCWVVGPSPTGDWADRAGQVAGWTEGGWRFASAVDGMRLFDSASGSNLLFRSGSWLGAMTAPAPSGGDVIDQEARDSIATIIAALHRAGLLLAN